jgi:hypothetical protein
MTPTTDQRERALEAFRQDRKSGFALQYGEDIADTIEAALTAPPHVPQEVVEFLDALRTEDHEFGSVHTHATYQKALALLMQGRVK